MNSSGAAYSGVIAPSLAARLIERQALHQPEVGHLDVVADQKQVARLDVEMLQMALHVEHVQHLGRFAQVEEQLGAWNARLARGLVLLQQLMHVLVGQLRDDDQFAVDAFEPVDGQQKGMANGLDVLNGLEFVLGPLADRCSAR